MISALKDLETELVILGDLNSTWLDKRPHVRQLAEGLGLSAYSPEGDELGTYKSISGKRLDWILISSNLEFVSYEVQPDIVADHLAIVAEIRVRGE
jgi:endonuclease/exonuclease/phosphatase family metal-dependent hydrolase